MLFSMIEVCNVYEDFIIINVLAGTENFHFWWFIHLSAKFLTPCQPHCIQRSAYDFQWKTVVLIGHAQPVA